MNKYALVGKNISHSKSPQMYHQLFQSKITYDLLDYREVSDIPKALDLFQMYKGINITSPYKKHFLKEVELTSSASRLSAINCLKKKSEKIIGENTDFLAILDIVKRIETQYGLLQIIILGDGVMSGVTQAAISDLEMKCTVLSRKKIDNFENINLESYLHNTTAKTLVINTCAREYVFKGNIPKNSIFWDYNYDFFSHQKSIPEKVESYIDGTDMLFLQARYAVAFWST